MDKIINWLKDVFVYGGITPEEYQEVRDQIGRKNRRMLQVGTGIAGSILFFLFFISFVSPTISNNHYLYGGIWVVVASLGIISWRWKSARPTVILGGCYLFLMIVYGFAIALGTVFQPSVPATTFCVLLFIGPLLFVDRPWRTSLLLVVVTVLFCAVTFRVKKFQYAQLDEVNSVSFLFVSIAVNACVCRTKMRDLIQQRHIERERDTDSLTQLLTKAASERRVTEYMQITTDPAALLVIDIDDFKGINDTYGHAFGDAVLRIMGQCIRKVFRSSDVLGRFGGDEFVIFLPNMQKREIVVNRVERLVSLMKEQITVPERARVVHGSIGIAFYPEDGSTYEELFAHADEALYESKRKGKDCYVFYLDIEEGMTLSRKETDQ